jgi:hypothetical protein
MEERLRTLSEAECYARCYGWRWEDDSVKVLPSGFRQDGPRSRDELAQRGERLRRLFELRIDAREAEAA